MQKGCNTNTFCNCRRIFYFWLSTSPKEFYFIRLQWLQCVALTYVLLVSLFLTVNFSKSLQNFVKARTSKHSEVLARVLHRGHPNEVLYLRKCLTVKHKHFITNPTSIWMKLLMWGIGERKRCLLWKTSNRNESRDESLDHDNTSLLLTSLERRESAGIFSSNLEPFCSHLSKLLDFSQQLSLSVTRSFNKPPLMFTNLLLLFSLAYSFFLHLELFNWVIY